MSTESEKQNPKPTPVHVLISGSRDWTDHKTIHQALDKINNQYNTDDTILPLCMIPKVGTFVLIHGACPTGADKIARDYAVNTLHWQEQAYPAQWSVHGKAAGPIRNKEMVLESKPQIALVFCLNSSRGTLNALNELQKYALLPESRLTRIETFYQRLLPCHRRSLPLSPRRKFQPNFAHAKRAKVESKQ